MCLDKIIREEILTEDLEVKKLVRKEPGGRVRTGLGFSNKIFLPMGELVEAISNRLPVWIKIDDADYYEEGFHCYELKTPNQVILKDWSLEMYVNHAYAIIKCSIPKGTKVLIGGDYGFNYEMIVTPIIKNEGEI